MPRTSPYGRLASIPLSLILVDWFLVGPAVLLPSPSAEAQTETSPVDVPPVAPPGAWERFRIFVWQYKTDAIQDQGLYEQIGLNAFHIDRGAGQEERVRFARRMGWPYYVDHAADKGFLHLTDRTGLGDLPRDGSLAERPQSLAAPATLARMKRELDRNIATTREGPVAAYAFDDEISLGHFNSPIEVDASPASVASYRRSLARAYGSVGALNDQWDARYGSFDEVEPVGFEAVRPEHNAPPILDWNLGPWMDWRAAMDTQFASVLAELTRHANGLDPDVPAGFVGGQQPAPYGGFDYAKIARAVQWAECYDIGGTNEILRSFWSDPRRPHVQTFFSSGNPKIDSWFLWYYLVHGNRGVIAWPDRGGQPWFRTEGGDLIAPAIAANAETFREVQGAISEAILDPGARFESDPIAILYSHPSVQASWAMDVTVHGKTWPRRSSSLDNANQSAGQSRVAWFKLLEDRKLQYDVLDPAAVEGGALIDRDYRVLILNRAIALSDETCEAIRAFVERGGLVVADGLTALLDEHGRGRGDAGGLDDLFGIVRDEAAGYFDGTTLAEIDGERYQQPLLERLRYPMGTLPADSAAIDESTPLPVIERGTRPREDDPAVEALTLIDPSAAPATLARRGEGHAVYLNRSVLAYLDPALRGNARLAWRDLIGDILARVGILPYAKVESVGDGGGDPIPFVEVIRWRRGDRLVIAVVKNPTRQGSISSIGTVAGLTGDPLRVRVTFAEPKSGLVDLRTGRRLPDGAVIDGTWEPWQALLYECDAPGPVANP